MVPLLSVRSGIVHIDSAGHWIRKEMSFGECMFQTAGEVRHKFRINKVYILLLSSFFNYFM